MPTDHRRKLKRIRRFDQLVAYLRDEMKWPIGSTDFEDLVFEYTPEELGIDPQNAAKIQEIKRLRPLSTRQPWGIFFVKFEPKRLPVVALRRILSQVALKNRASANSAERQAWETDDLLFISNYGEGEERQISFAHFSQSDDRTDLPTLKVLGWDNRDTPLHLDHVGELLTERLAWPQDDKDSEGWRKTWRSAFTLRHREVIQTSRELSERLAELARAIRDRIQTALAIETESGRLTKLMNAFQKSLVHDLDEEGFADMYAQTIAYGLLSSRIADPSKKTADDFAAHMRTNPFLRELMETFLHLGGRKGKAGGPGIDFDELGVTDVIDLLDDANMEEVIRDFGDEKPEEDPVIHFYELFLQKYDEKKRMERGVFYTPRPVVSFIVRSVDRILRDYLGLKDGLADTTTWAEFLEGSADLDIPEGLSPDQPFVQILDPATGTGTFLVEAIDVIYETLCRKWESEGQSKQEMLRLWNEYVPGHLLPRLHGYELMMAPYAIAHMKIGLKLYETGYRFSTDERARIYLTNSLEAPHDHSGTFEFSIPALAHEAAEVNAIKANKRFTVIIGNPPYSASISEPDWLMEKLTDWKRGLSEKKLDINREEWKFLRLGEHLCEESGTGVIGHVINRDLLDGIVKRQMRHHLQDCFPVRLVYDLNGDVKGNVSDQNVFDIQQGVCILILIKVKRMPEHFFKSLVGTRQSKYQFLLETPGAEGAEKAPSPVEPYFSWVPSDNLDNVDDEKAFESWRQINTIFLSYSSGIQTKRDRFTVHYTESEVWETVSNFGHLSVEEAREQYDLGNDGRDWTVAKAKEDIEESGPNKEHICPLLYRPFDTRFTYWTGKTKGFLAYPRREVMRHVVGYENIGMIFNRQIVGDSVSHFGVSRTPICHGTFYLGNKGQDYFAPLYLFDEGLLASEDPAPNIAADFLADLDLSAEQKFGYVYAVCWSATYRNRYAALIKRDFARIPEDVSQELAEELSALGSELISQHLLDIPPQCIGEIDTIGSPPYQVEKVSYSDNSVWIDKAKTKGFCNVSDQAWNFEFGGYRVCEKWLKDRQAKGGKSPSAGRLLSPDDVEHYKKIVMMAILSLQTVSQIDNVIAEAGGWPGAFLD